MKILVMPLKLFLRFYDQSTNSIKSKFYVKNVKYLRILFYRLE